VRSLRRKILLRIAITVGFLILSCREALPPYQTPQNVLAGELAGLYVLSASDNSLKVFLTVRNEFDETLEGPAKLTGKIEIVLLRDPRIRKTAVLGPSNVLQAKGYNRQTGVLSLDPQDSIRLGYSWNLVDDNGIDLRTDVFSYLPDPTCPDTLPETRRIALGEKFLISGELLVFDQTGQVVPASREFVLCYVSNWVNPKFCPPILASESCRLRR